MSENTIHSELLNAILNNKPYLEIKKMIETGMDIRETDYAGRNILTYASMHNENPKLINYLVKKGLSVRQTDSNGNTLAHYAACNPNPKIMQTLIKLGVAFNKIVNHNTPLCIAAQEDNLEVCKVLVNAGAKLNPKDKGTKEALLASIKNSNFDLFGLLVDAGAKITKEAFNYALEYFSIEQVAFLAHILKIKFDNSDFEAYINCSNRNSYIKKHEVYHSFVLPFVSDINYTDPPLPYIYSAAANPDVRVLEFLKEEGCDLKLGNYKENIFTHALSRNPNPDVIDYLISKELFISDSYFAALCLLKNPSVDMWKKAFEIGLPKDFRFKNGDSLLIGVLQTENPNPEVIKLLSSEPSILNLKDDEGNTACHIAAKKENPVYLEILKTFGANLNEKNKFGGSPFLFACAENPNVEVIDWLLQNGADINECANNNTNAFLCSMQNPNEQISKHLIELGVNIHVKNSRGENALMIALRNKASYEKIKYLLSLGFNLNDKDLDGYSLIFIAAADNPNLEVLDLLIQNGADIGFTPESDPKLNLLIASCTNSNEAILDYFIEKGFDVNSSTSNGTTALMIAAKNPNVKLFNNLIKNGADINAVDSSGYDCAVYAIGNNPNPYIVLYLKYNGVDIKKTYENGTNLAHVASFNPNPEIMQTLIDFGVPFDMENEQEFHTPLDLSALYGYVDVCRVLLEYGSRLEHRDADGCTPLLLATKNKNPEVLSFLFKAGANINAKDYNKRNIIHYALANSSLELIKELIEIKKVKIDNSNFEHYLRHINILRELQDYWNNIGFNSEVKKKNHSYLFYAAINPDLRVLDYFKEIGCDFQLTKDIEENAWTYALRNNPNPMIIDYFFGSKIESDFYKFLAYNICLNSSAEVWQRALEAGLPKDYQDSNGSSLLINYLECNSNPNPYVVALLADKTTVNIKDNNGMTAAHCAAKKENIVYLQILKEAGALLNEKENIYGITPLMSACSFNPNPEIIDFLIKNGADISERDMMGHDALYIAIGNSNYRIAKFLIECHKGNIYSKDRDGLNLLMRAIKVNQTPLIEYFIDLGININDKDNYGYPAIAYAAAFAKYPEVLEFLVKKGADINFKTDKGENLLILAARNNESVAVIEYLLNKGFSKDYLTKEGETPVLAAAQNENVMIMDKLLEHGANLNAVNNRKENALFIAAKCNNKPYMISYLLDKGIPLNYSDENDNNVVLYAAQNQNVNILRMLVAKGADLKSSNADGITALMMAVSVENNIGVVKYLIENGAEINEKMSNNASALMIAAASITDSPECVELLITAGADLYAQDDNGNNAYKIAKEYNPNPAIAETILKHMIGGAYSNSTFGFPKETDIN